MRTDLAPGLNGSVALPRVNPDVVHRRVGDEVVLVHLERNQIFALNETGMRFWELLAEGRERHEIEETMLSEFEVEQPALAAEIDSLLERLAEARLVDPS